jgi:hypothetical protein
VVDFSEWKDQLRKDPWKELAATKQTLDPSRLGDPPKI